MLFFAIKCSIRPNKVVSKDVGGKKKKNRKSFRTGTDSLNHVYHITKSIKKHKVLQVLQSCLETSGDEP